VRRAFSRSSFDFSESAAASRSRESIPPPWYSGSANWSPIVLVVTSAPAGLVA